MRLLGQKDSINVRKVLWTCAELGLSPEREDWGGSTRTTRDPEFLSINPKGLVPVLIDGGLVLTESNAICRYLALREGCSDLLPEQPTQRAAVDAWMDWQATELNTSWRAAFKGLVRCHAAFSDRALQSKSTGDWNAAMALLDRSIGSGGPFVCGATFTLADIVLALSTNRWEQTPIERPELPAVEAWMTRLAARPGFAEHCRNGVP
ncbi:MAG: glutathione S-transferase family protein [Pseudomonadota bacterium]